MTQLIKQNISNIDIVYNNLYVAFTKRDRKAIEFYCESCERLGIPQFHEQANIEMARIYASIGIRTIQQKSTIETLPFDVLRVYAQACMNVLFNIKYDIFKSQCQYAFFTLARPTTFKSNDILYTRQDNKLTVGNFLKVIKYAISIIDIINPDNKANSYANASLLALQEIDNLLNNKSGAEITRHTLHVATDFIASNVKNSLNDSSSKRAVAITALWVNLTIDFLIKD